MYFNFDFLPILGKFWIFIKVIYREIGSIPRFSFQQLSENVLRLHFKGFVTISGHLSDKIFIASHFIKNTKSYLSNIANRLYFQKIVGFPIVGTLEMGFSDAFVSKNTSKSPISHDKIPCPTSHNDIFCLNDGHLEVILDLLPLHIPRRT